TCRVTRPPRRVKLHSHALQACAHAIEVGIASEFEASYLRRAGNWTTPAAINAGFAAVLDAIATRRDGSQVGQLQAFRLNQYDVGFEPNLRATDTAVDVTARKDVHLTSWSVKRSIELHVRADSYGARR